MGISIFPTLFIFLASLSLAAPQQFTNTSSPTVTTNNGTILGTYLPSYNQDAFLGIPFAQPPIGNLRFQRPKPYDGSWSGVRNAQAYGPSCMQYASTVGFQGQGDQISEDCLTLNVVRPHASSYTSNSTRLPVLVWIFGGGLYAGSTADPQYNLSGIVALSSELNFPAIAVSFNYRLGMWGFLSTPTLLSESNTNAGLYDQRLAMRWIQDNIASFGGDADRVTIWGESAGAQSVSFHLTAYEGRWAPGEEGSSGKGLFQGAIMESGGTVGAQLQSLAYYAAPVENLTRAVGCPLVGSGVWTGDQMQCLRNVPSKVLWDARPLATFNPLVDGDFLPDYPSTLLKAGKHHRLPVITGANTDEGVSFGPKGVSDTTSLFNTFLWYRNYALSPASLRQLISLYPEDPKPGTTYPPYNIDNNATSPYPASYGAQWRRACAIGGDMVMVGQRRMMCEAMANASSPVWSYRFNTRPFNVSEWDGIKHFVNVAFSFQNISGQLGPATAEGAQGRRAVSKQVGEAYIRFVNDWNPNGSGYGDQTGSSLAWPKWNEAGSNWNMVFDDKGSFVEKDDWRSQEIAYVNTLSRELLG